MAHRFSRKTWAMAWLWLLALLGLPALAAPQLTVSPSGTLSGMANVPIVVTLDNPEQLATRSFKVLVNNQDVTEAFTRVARVSSNGTRITARVDYLFAPGQWSVEARVGLANASGNQITEITATSPFTVPGDAQERRKAGVMQKVSAYMNQFEPYMFNAFIKLGNYDTFNARLNQSDMQVYVDPVFLDTNNAAYVEVYWFGLSYYHDLVIRAEPELYGVGNATYDAQTLWHEMVHAVSHGVQVSTGSAPLPMDDHAYLGRVQACIAALTNNLSTFDDFLRANGKNPTPAVAAQIRNKWKGFRSFCTESRWTAYPENGYPTDAQMQAFKSLTGVDVNADTIKQGYLAAGYSPLYFTDLSVSIGSPASGIEINSNQVPVAASFTNNEPDLVVDHVGFVINGAVQEAPRAGNEFQTTAILRTGDNLITAVVVTTDGQVFSSTPVTVKSNALNNRYHIRITWDKNDTDVDLHFSWNSSDCYYGNKTPTWGAAATSPRLDVDDTNGFGPENITIDALPGPGTYRIWVRYYGDHGNGATTVYASIFMDGQSISSQSRTLSTGQNWTLYEFTIP